tara:strand:+ start:107 stop:307 length:201 start_codon:yes stop_codon:yes gene_type:complete
VIGVIAEFPQKTGNLMFVGFDSLHPFNFSTLHSERFAASMEERGADFLVKRDTILDKCWECHPTLP